MISATPDYSLLRALLEKHAKGQRAALSVSVYCACFSCLRRYHPSEPYYWRPDETTAVCPYCYQSTVIASASKLDLTVEALARMKRAEAS